MTATIIVEYHDDIKTVITREGEVITEERPYTVEEIAAADARNAVVNNESTLRIDAIAQLEGMLTSIIALQVVLDKPNATLTAVDTKTIARELRKAIRQLVRITRLQFGMTDTADTGIE